MLMPFELMYRLRFTPWELRPVVPAWQRIANGPDAPPLTGRWMSAAGMTELAAPGATALLAAFAPARPVLPRG